MKVLLIKDVKGTGKTGEVKEVKDGYGKNFLIAKGFALHANDEVIENHKKEMALKAEQEALEIKETNELAQKLNSTKITIRHKIGANGHLIGSVTNKEISEVLNSDFGINIDKKVMTLKNKIKTEGIFEVDCKLGHGIHATLKVDIIGA